MMKFNYKNKEYIVDEPTVEMFNHSLPIMIVSRT